MSLKRTLKGGVLITAWFAVVSAPFFVLEADAAQGPLVVESRDSKVTYQPPIEDNGSQGTIYEGESGGAEEQYQMQLLQQEIMQLRGLVEELQYQLNRLKSIQDDRYLELDSRLQQVMRAGSERPPTQPVTTPPVTGNPVAGDPIDTTDGDVSERDLYETTQILIRNRQYDMAVAQLDALIAKYPDGQYTGNAYYWLGQVYAAMSPPDFEKARQALAQVITYFPDHNKVPDAAYALGKVYHALGDCERATELLQSVVDQYPGKSAATLSQTYLRESVACEP